MRKRSVFFICFLWLLVLLCPSFAKEQEKNKNDSPTEIYKAELIFEKKTVTTKNLEQLLQNKGLLLSFTFQNNFSYLDTTMKKKLSLIYSPNIKVYEQKFKEQLESYGFFEESERIVRQGILLERVIVRIPSSVLYSLKKTEGIKVKL